jgi:hypothetical protein
MRLVAAQVACAHEDRREITMLATTVSARAT